MQKFVEIYGMQQRSTKDLSSITLSKQKGELTLIGDIEEKKALELFKENLKYKYPDGNIP